MSCAHHIHHHRLGDNHGAEHVVVTQEIRIDGKWYLCCMHIAQFTYFLN